MEVVDEAMGPSHRQQKMAIQPNLAMKAQVELVSVVGVVTTNPAAVSREPAIEGW